MSPTPRALTTQEVCELLNIPKRSFYHLRKTGALPMVEELKPRIGRIARFRADLIERYLEGQWGQPRSFASHRKVGAR
jgi:excisionase family DNA binding protein